MNIIQEDFDTTSDEQGMSAHHHPHHRGDGITNASIMRRQNKLILEAKRYSICKVIAWGLCTVLLVCFLISLWRCVKSRREDFKFELINDDLVRVKTDMLAKLHRNVDKMLNVILKIKANRKYTPNDEKAFNIIMENAEIVKTRWNQITMKELDTMQVNNNETTHVIQKGKELFIGMRKALKNPYFIPGFGKFLAQYKYTAEFYPYDVLMYVLIHETGHMFCPEYQHTPLFWRINKELLRIAIKNGVIPYVDYSEHPQQYYAVLIESNIVQLD